jgi:hypothetical protein
MFSLFEIRIFRNSITFSIQIVGKTLEYMVDHFCNRSVELNVTSIFT